MKLKLIIALCLILVWLSPVGVEGATQEASTSPLLEVSEVSAHTNRAVEISWKTNIKAISQLYYDTESHEDIADYAFFVEDLALTAEHKIGLTGLSPGTLYHYRVRAAIPGTEAAAISDDYTFISPTPINWAPIIGAFVGGIIIILLVYIAILRRRQRSA